MFGYIPQDLSFQVSHAAFLLICLIPLALAQILYFRYQKKMERAFASPSLLNSLLIPRSSIIQHTKNFFWLLILSLITLALMEPVGNKRYDTMPLNSSSIELPHQIVFLIDASASMGVLDGYHGESRLDSAKAIIENLLHDLKGQTVSLYAFTSELTPLVPPTFDVLFTRMMLHELQINEGGVGGTDIEHALEKMNTELLSQSPHQETFLVLLTDGGEISDDSAMMSSIGEAEKNHIHLITVGLGSLSPQIIPHVTFQGKPVTSQLQPQILEALAKKYDGRFYHANDWNAFNCAESITQEIAQNLTHERQRIVPVTDLKLSYSRYFQIPLGMAIVFYFINLSLNKRKRKT